MARAASANAEEFLTSSQKQVKITQRFFFEWQITNSACDRNIFFFFLLFLLPFQGQRVIRISTENK